MQDINTVIPSSGIYNNEMAANSKIAAVMFESDMVSLEGLKNAE